MILVILSLHFEKFCYFLMDPNLAVANEKPPHEHERHDDK